MHGTRAFMAAVAVAAPLILSAGPARATVIVDIQPGQWRQAIADGVVVGQGGQAYTGAADAFYSGQNMGNVAAQIQPTELVPDVAVQDNSGTTFEALVMGWELPNNPNDANDPINNQLAVGAFNVDLRAVTQGQPYYNLATGSSMVHFSLFAPPGVWDISMELIDDMNRSRGFFLSMPPPGITGLWVNCWLPINARGLVTADACMDQLMAPIPGTGFQIFTDPGFDPSRVAAVRFDEAGMFSMPFPVPPGGLPGGFGWNAWNHVRIEAPEPMTLGLIGAGLAGIAFAGRRRRRR